MKRSLAFYKAFFLFAFAGLLSVLTSTVMAQTSFQSLPAHEAPDAEGLKMPAMHFLENKGQVHDMNGRAMPSVLFLAQAPGLTVYITEQGLTYLFLKADPPAKRPTPEEQWMEQHPPKIPVYWERVDVVLKGAHISKRKFV